MMRHEDVEQARKATASVSADESVIDVVILAGGKGTRLQSVVSDVPKPLAPINGRPFVDYQFALLQKTPRIGRVVLAIGHLADRVIAHYAEHKPPVDLLFAVEASPLGTAGALRNALSSTTSRQILALNGDSIFNWDIEAIRTVHKRCGGEATISLLQVEDISRYGSVAVENERVVSFREKSSHSQPGTINAGVYLFERAAIEAIPTGGAVSLELETLPAMAAEGKLAAATFKSDFIDIGLPETYELATTFIPRLFSAP
jgi:D-glycero-alpha-D-manno-heptose 1-phosphate guanylyltransferase